jgi:hypothetical protein
MTSRHPRKTRHMSMLEHLRGIAALAPLRGGVPAGARVDMGYDPRDAIT